MSDVVCSSCSISSDLEVPQFYATYRGTSDIVPEGEIRDACIESGVSPTTLALFAAEGVDIHPKLPHYELHCRQVTVPVAQDKVFDGTEDEAEAAGWVQNEFGWVCTDCVGVEHHGSNSATERGQDEAVDLVLATLLKEKAKKEEEKAKKEESK